MSAEFDAIRARYLGRPGIAERRMFGSVGLSLNGTGFVMLYKGKLIVKLGPEAVDALLAEGLAERFDPGHGRKMKAWAEITETHAARWSDLADRAHAFVAGAG